MCGIIAYTGKDEAAEILLQGLYALEYRGYDSAGVAVMNTTNADVPTISITKRVGAVKVLDEALQKSPIKGTTGIGHTRWATHGAPTEKNAHPHVDTHRTVAIVHNGIIENFKELKDELLKEGDVFLSDTDSEVIAHLIAKHYKGDVKKAVQETTKELRGAYAFVALHVNHPYELVAAREGSPLVCGISDTGAYAASDILALSKYVKFSITLDNGQIAHLKNDGSVKIFDHEDNEIDVVPEALEASVQNNGTGEFDDFMLKEINEQPEVIARLTSDYVKDDHINFTNLRLTKEKLDTVHRIAIVACGTSYYASLVAKHYFERLCKIPVECYIASEFNYTETLIDEHTLCIIVTQSGETADTLTAARKMKVQGADVIAITNVQGSTAAKEADGVIYTEAGPEVSVASTKSYTAQITVFYLLSLYIAEKLNLLDDVQIQSLLASLRIVPALLTEELHDQKLAQAIDHASDICAPRSSALFLGRGIDFPSALEGSLKLKELSYLHAEAYAAGEMKHGPIALLDKGFPVVVLIPHSKTFEKTMSNIQEVNARGAAVIALATKGDESFIHSVEETLWIPQCAELMLPLVAVVPLQLLAHEVANKRGACIDRPRNLAKSVTVE